MINNGQGKALASNFREVSMETRQGIELFALIEHFSDLLRKSSFEKTTPDEKSGLFYAMRMVLPDIEFKMKPDNLAQLSEPDCNYFLHQLSDFILVGDEECAQSALSVMKTLLERSDLLVLALDLRDTLLMTQDLHEHPFAVQAIQLLTRNASKNDWQTGSIYLANEGGNHLKV